jgi:predicted phosphoribosyltransferase
MTLFRDRTHAGQVLAALLRPYAHRPDVLVLALPRGGVPVAAVIARELQLPLDVFLVRKLGVPGQEELAMGALASDGVRILNEDVITALSISDDVIDDVTAVEQRELERRDRLYRDDRPPPDVRGRTILLVDDGLATGSTMRAAIAALRRLQPAQIVVAVPVGAPQTCAEIARQADDVVCARTPEPFIAVGAWYRDFGQTSDAEVSELLRQAAERDAVFDGA